MTFEKGICSLGLFVLLAFLAGQALAAAEAAPADKESAGEVERDWTALPDDEAELEVWDPLESFNRGVFWFNDRLYFYALKPLARGYRAVTPVPVQESVGNFFRNLTAPVRVVNSLLQGKAKGAADEFTIFCANSTVGLGGLFDLHKDTPNRPQAEDFGQTLGHYGTPAGFYLVLPVLGATSARDAVGLAADSLASPVSSPYYVKLQALESAGLRTFDTVNRLALDKDTYETIKRDALDPYLFVRNAYMQQREAKVAK